jgi:hypothetical protein
MMIASLEVGPGVGVALAGVGVGGWVTGGVARAGHTPGVGDGERKGQMGGFS